MALAGALKAAQLESAAAFWSRSVNIPASGDGGAADVVVYNAAMPQAGILFGLIYTNTGGLGGATMTVRDAVGGGGNALSAAAASAMRVTEPASCLIRSFIGWIPLEPG